jgi:chemotaxis protein methyltransferase CheR
MQENLVLNDKQKADYDAFKMHVFRKTGIDLNLYKAQQMHRRLMGLVERSNLTSFTEYVHLLEKDPNEFAIFLDRLTINVSELFRNPEKWEEMKDKVLPDLLRERKLLRIWSAGCSYGAEPYTLAMLLDQASPHIKHSILATDIDQKILAKAKEGIYTDADIRNIPQSYRVKYLVQQGAKYQISRELRDRVTFRAHNLLKDPFDHDFDLIVCRNVVIYFTDEAKDRLFSRFTQALRPGGILFVGGTERIFNYKELGLDSRLPFFYQRAA